MTRNSVSKIAAAGLAASIAVSMMTGVTVSAASSVSASASYPYYCTTTNQYYSSYEEAAAAAGSAGSVSVWSGYVYNGSSSALPSSSYPYFSAATGRYYATWSDAYLASAGDRSAVTTYDNHDYASWSSEHPYYSSYTKRYYTSYIDALAASNGDGSYVTNSAYYDLYSYYNYGYYNPYYSYYYDPYISSYYNPYYGGIPNDPYFIYFNAMYNNKNEKNSGKDKTLKEETITEIITADDTDESASSSSAAAEIGTPYLYGKPSVSGWSVLAGKIKAAEDGQKISINMNGATIISSKVLKAAKGKDVTIQFMLSNNRICTVYGGDIKSCANTDISVIKGAATMPADKVEALTQNAKSFAKFTIGQSGNFGFKGDFTFKLSSENKDSFVSIYYYNEKTNKMLSVGKSVTDATGLCHINVSHGGEYIAVIS